MSELTASELHQLLAPLWEREPGLRVTRLFYGAYGKTWNGIEQWVWKLKVGIEVYRNHYHVANCVATQLCESQMVRWLGRRGNHPDIHFDEDGYVWHVGICDTAETVRSFTGLCLVQALASACTAALDAKKEVNDE